MTVGLVNPLPGHAITQHFDGSYYNPSTGIGEKPGWLYSDTHGPWAASKVAVAGWQSRAHLHCALDQGAPTGTQIVAPERMKIVINTIDPASGDHYIVAEVRPGTVFHFDHLSKVMVPVGTVVAKGAKGWALVGATGHVTGPHLHWEVRHTGSAVPDYRKNYLWRRYNPERMLVGKDKAATPWIVPSH